MFKSVLLVAAALAWAIPAAARENAFSLSTEFGDSALDIRVKVVGPTKDGRVRTQVRAELSASEGGLDAGSQQSFEVIAGDAVTAHVAGLLLVAGTMAGTSRAGIASVLKNGGVKANFEHERSTTGRVSPAPATVQAIVALIDSTIAVAGPDGDGGLRARFRAAAEALGLTSTFAAPQPATSGLQVLGEADFRQRVAADLARFAPGTTVDANGYVRRAASKVAGHEQGYQLINDLLNNPNKVKIQLALKSAFTVSGPGADGTVDRPGAGSTATVSYDPNLTVIRPALQADGTIKDEGTASEIVLAHELVHAAHAQRGTIDRGSADHFFSEGGVPYKETTEAERFRAVGFTGFRQGSEPSENSIRAELGYTPRAAYLDRSSWTAVNG